MSEEIKQNFEQAESVKPITKAFWITGKNGKTKIK